MVVRRRGKQPTETQPTQVQPKSERLQTAEGWRCEIIETHGKPPHPVQAEKQIEQKSPRG